MSGPSRVTVTRGGDGTPQIATRAPTYGALVGVTEMGPIGSPFAVPEDKAPITSWSEWSSIYGGLTANAQDAPNAAKGFFDEGGQFLYTSRVVHTTTPGDPTTKTSAKGTLNLLTAIVAASAGFLLGSAVGPYALTPADHVDVKIDGASAAVATFAAAAASRDSAVGPFALADGDVLNVTINGTAVVFTFDSTNITVGAATAAQVAAVMNAKLASLNPSVRAQATVVGGAVRLATTWKGTGASINVTGGSANAGKLAYTTGNLAGTGNVADIAAVTVAEAKTIIEAAVAGCTVSNVGGATKIASNTTGGSSSVQATTASSAGLLTAFGFDTAVHSGGAAGTAPTLQVDGKWDGSYANELSPRVSVAASGASDRRDFALLRGGLVVESWRDASWDTGDPNYIETLVNLGTSTQRASKLVKVTDLAAAYPSPDNLPAVGTFGPLAGGSDGLASLADTDFYGAQTTNGATGLYVFNAIERVDVACIPGRCTAAVQGQAVTWAEVYREGRTFVILAVPSGLTVNAARTYVTSTASLKGLTEIAAMYGPWMHIDNPSKTIFGSAKTIPVPPEGALMGLFCRVDASKEGGAFEHPSNALGVLRTARGVESDEYEDPVKRGLAFDDFINAIRAQRGKPIHVDGARCLKTTGPFPTVGESRGAMLVTNQLIEAYDDLRNAAIRDRLYTSLSTAAKVYLGKLAKAECFRTKDPASAFFVDFGPGLNTPEVVEAREVLGTIGINTAPPAEFIFITIVPFAGLAANFATQVQEASPTGI